MLLVKLKFARRNNPANTRCLAIVALMLGHIKTSMFQRLVSARDVFM